MIKYFNELTEKEFDQLVEQKKTWADIKEDYPQPSWCSYPDATAGLMGCWSLIYFRITSEDICKDCEYHIGVNK